jgi:uncharacterized membrane protein YqiK
MSLKATTKAVRGWHESDALRKEAEAELRALRKAADTLGVCGWLTSIEKDVNATKAECEAVAVLKAIAKEAE